MSASWQDRQGVQHCRSCCPPWASRRHQWADASAILSELPGLQVIDRTTMNAFEIAPFREAVKKTAQR